MTVQGRPTQETARRPQRAGTAGGRVSVMEQALWRRLTTAENLDDLAPAWLALQCTRLADIQSAAVIRLADGRRAAIAVWPDGTSDLNHFTGTVDLALSQNRGVIQRAEAKDKARTSTRIGLPVITEGTSEGVIVMEIASDAEDQLRRTMRELQWGAAWLHGEFLRRKAADHHAAASQTRSALELLATGLEAHGFKDACRAVTTEIATRSKCERVSVGFRRNGVTSVAAISFSAQFGRKMNLVRAIGQAMDEATDQQAVLHFPPPEDEPLVTRAHAELSRLHGSPNLLTAPIHFDDDFIGAFTFERADDAPFTQEDVIYLESIAAIVGPILEEKRQNDRWLIFKGLDVTAGHLRRLIGPGYFKRKLAAAVLLLLALLFTFWHTDYRISADAQIEGEVQRSVVVAFDGFIAQSYVRAGDEVQAGDLLATLEDRDLLLERVRWASEQQRSQFAYERALGRGERVEGRIALSEVSQAEAQLRLIEEKLERTAMVAPFDGLIVAGDLSQKIGAAVKRGDTLFQVTPLDTYRVILKVDEYQIGDVRENTTGQLRVAALPGDAFDILVETITPVATAEDGGNHFRVEAQLVSGSERLRPGMKGVGRIDAGEARLIWVWTRGLNEWLTLEFWRWFG